MTTALVTGGAGFIGTALSAPLAARFDRVVAMDNLHPQVHPSRTRPAALHADVELVEGDVTDAAAFDRVLGDVRPDVVIHLAAETGTGQSLTEATRHALVNVVGTTQLLDALVRHDVRPERIVLTSSRAVYGEGAWRDADGAVTYPGQRTDAMLAAQQWDFPGLSVLPFDARTVQPVPTSVYGSTKLAQEHVLLSWCHAMSVTPVLYRLQNVYGPGQSLSNPYTGIVPFFAQKAKAQEQIPVYEDGQIVRDFVFIDDVVSALLAGLDLDGGATVPFDIGSGEGTTIWRLAEIVAGIYGAPEPHVTGQYRNGDVRAASGVVDHAVETLGWEPTVGVEEGVRRLCAWIDAGQPDEPER